jgi:hypothetical protein
MCQRESVRRSQTGAPDRQELIDSIAPCGLICKLCHLADRCDGCKATASGCENHSAKWGGCYHRHCCLGKGLKGCWECSDAPCDQDMFSQTHDLRIRAFVRCLKEEGPERLIDYLVANQARGIRYGYQKDYDGKASEAEVLVLLRTGFTPTSE